MYAAHPYFPNNMYQPHLMGPNGMTMTPQPPNMYGRPSLSGGYVVNPQDLNKTHSIPDQQTMWQHPQFPGGQLPPQFQPHQMAPQFQGQPPPFYPVQVSPQQGRNSTMAPTHQNIIYHTTLNGQPQHINGPIYQTFDQQGIIYAPSQIIQQQPQQQGNNNKVTENGDGKSVKSDVNVKFNNLHSHQPQPKPELKSGAAGTKNNGVPVPVNGLKSPENSNKRPKSTTYGKKRGGGLDKHNNNVNINNNAPHEFASLVAENKRSNRRRKGKTNTSHQSDSLLRKKQHRRSLSSGVLPKTTLQTNVSQPYHNTARHNTTPPPGNMYSDELNKQASNRGLGSHNNEHSNTSR